MPVVIFPLNRFDWNGEKFELGEGINIIRTTINKFDSINALIGRMDIRGIGRCSHSLTFEEPYPFNLSYKGAINLFLFCLRVIKYSGIHTSRYIARIPGEPVNYARVLRKFVFVNHRTIPRINSSDLIETKRLFHASTEIYGKRNLLAAAHYFT